jgi:hypothetical protein
VIFRNKFVFSVRIVSPTSNPQARGPPLVDCQLLLIQYILGYHPYLKGVSPIRNLRTRHAVVTRDPPMGRPRRRLVDNIKLDLREIGWGGMNWIDLAQDRDRWRALVNTVMNLRVPELLRSS